MSLSLVGGVAVYRLAGAGQRSPERSEKWVVHGHRQAAAMQPFHRFAGEHHPAKAPALVINRNDNRV